MTTLESTARRRSGLLPLVVLASAVLWPAAAAAQAPAPSEGYYRWTAGWGASWISYTAFVDAGDAGLEQPIELDSGLGATVFVDRWFNRWIGLHLDLTYDRASLSVPAASPEIDVWAGNLGLSVRPWGGTAAVSPYVFGSGGVISYGIGGTSIQLAGSEVVYSAEETDQLLWQVGGGLDLALLRARDGSPIGAHVQVARVAVLDGPFRGANVDTEHDFWRFTLGLSTRLGRW